jgi:Zn-dependent M28 family amino/carboxypeptidase
MFIAFGGEEAGLVGSRYFVANPVLPLSQARFVLNLDLWGSGSKGVAVVNATEHPEWYASFLHSAGLFNVDVQKRGPAANSDHYPFVNAGVPAFFIYAKGDVGGYHNIGDTPDKLEQGEFYRMFKLLWDF